MSAIWSLEAAIIVLLISNLGMAIGWIGWRAVARAERQQRRQVADERDQLAHQLTWCKRRLEHETANTQRIYRRIVAGAKARHPATIPAPKLGVAPDGGGGAS